MSILQAYTVTLLDLLQHNKSFKPVDILFDVVVYKLRIIVHKNYDEMNIFFSDIFASFIVF